MHWKKFLWVWPDVMRWKVFCLWVWRDFCSHGLTSVWWRNMVDAHTLFFFFIISGNALKFFSYGYGLMWCVEKFFLMGMAWLLFTHCFFLKYGWEKNYARKNGTIPLRYLPLSYLGGRVQVLPNTYCDNIKQHILTT